MLEKEILCIFHYQGLHQSSYYKNNSLGADEIDLPFADLYSDCLVRLPLFYELHEFSGHLDD